MNPVKRIFLTVHTPAPGAAPEKVSVRLTRPDIVFGRHPEPDRRALHHAHRLLGASTFGGRVGDSVVLRRMDGLALPDPSHASTLFFFAHV
jgi:hypothetical protein